MSRSEAGGDFLLIETYATLILYVQKKMIYIWKVARLLSKKGISSLISTQGEDIQYTTAKGPIFFMEFVWELRA